MVIWELAHKTENLPTDDLCINSLIEPYVRVSIAVINSTTKSKLERKGIYCISQFHIIVCHGWKSGQAPGGRKWCRAHRRELLTARLHWLTQVALTGSFHINHNQYNTPQTCLQTNLIKAFSQLRSPLSRYV